MTFLVWFVIAVLVYIAMYAAAVSDTRWLQIVTYTGLSIVFAMLVTSNLF